MNGENIDTSSHTGGDLQKRAAWSAWAVKRMQSMKDLRHARILSDDNEFRNVAEHILVVNATALFVARKLNESGVPINEAVVNAASMAHDSTKRLDRMRGISYGTEHQEKTTRELLEQLGYDDEVIRAAEYTGRVPEMFLDEDAQDEALKAVPLERLVVAYADARVRNTDIVPLARARDMNKQKVPADSAVYDQWFTYYSKVEKRLFEGMKEAVTPEGLTNESVYQMVKNDL